MVENEKYLIVSPHSDDALLCAAHVILGDGFEVEIVTVENDPCLLYTSPSPRD